MKKLFQNLLARISCKILRKYKPRIVGITGSIGKTSAKEASFVVAKSKFRARTNIKNYNNEFGLPFTIIGVESPKRNPFKWLQLFIKSAWMLWVYLPYPEVLILEMGIDRPGDMDYLVSIAPPDIAVLTTIGISHLEFFGSENAILQEKSKIFSRMGEHGSAVLNIDDAKVRSVIPRLRSKIITYGFSQGADLRIVEHQTTYSKNDRSYGTLFKLSYKGATVPIFLSGTLGMPHLMACTAAAAVGLSLGMNLNECAAALANYRGQTGRLQIIPGMQGSTIIDDTYNAAPLSTQIALKELADFPAQKKVAILGDMLELGNLSEQSHRDIAKQLIDSSVDYFIGVGSQMKLAVEDLRIWRYKSDHVFWFEKSTDAIEKARQLVSEGAVILVKGSQGMRMEKIVREIMNDQSQAPKLLVRQEKDWLKK